jgi:hypothetical protein
LPARDIGPPYLRRFSGVSGTGPLVVRLVVTLALVPATSAEVVVDEVVTPVELDVVAEGADWMSVLWVVVVLLVAGPVSVVAVVVVLVG